MDNYRIARDRAQAYFLNFDQETIIRRWNLRHDAHFLYLEFLGRHYSVCRKTGTIIRASDGTQAEFSEVLSIYDFLCHQGQDQFLTGRFAPVNSLKNAPKAGGVNTCFYTKTAKKFDQSPGALHIACKALGWQPVPMGDIGYRIPVFQEITAILKFYHSDEDFPASVIFLWDENMLEFVFYETVFYIAGFILQTIEENMEYQKEEGNEPTV